MHTQRIRNEEMRAKKRERGGQRGRTGESVVRCLKVSQTNWRKKDAKWMKERTY